MRSNYDVLGKHIRLVDFRNKDEVTNTVLGISINKEFMPSVANVIGTDLSRYKLIQKGMFACNPMHVGRDERLPIALYKDDIPAIVSPAYFMFEIIDPTILDMDYLMMWFRRPEFDRECWFMTDGSVRGGITWDDLCRIRIPVPHIEKQHSIVKAYKVITDRIALNRKINEDLVASLSTVYKELFSDAKTQYLKVPLQKICTKIGSGATPKGGKTAYIDEGISLIRSTNVFDFRFEYSDLAHINQTQADALSNVTVEPNDVLFNITGVSVARCCMVPDDVLPARVNQHVMIVRPAKGVAMSYYIMFTLCSAGNKAKLLGIGQSGSTREAINKQELESFEIPIPDDDSLNKFGEIALCAYKNIQCNVKEIRILEDMKSILLAQLSNR